MEDDFKLGTAPKAQGGAGTQDNYNGDTTIGLNGTLGVGGMIQPLGGNATAMLDDSAAMDLVAGLNGVRTPQEEADEV